MHERFFGQAIGRFGTVNNAQPDTGQRNKLNSVAVVVIEKQ
jgi:hypothetical protein